MCEFSLASLSSRIAEVRAQPEPEAVRLLMLDAMVPRQRLEIQEAPASLVQTVEDSLRADTSLVVLEPHRPSLNTWNDEDQVWKPDKRLQQAAHGVEVIPAIARGKDGDATLTLAAKRWCEVVSIDADNGSNLQGRAGMVRWRALDALEPEEQPTPAVLDRSKALADMVEEWVSCVCAAGSGATVQQLESRLELLGEMPPAERPSDLALWVAALINPCSVGGGAPGSLALEVRPDALRAPAADARVRVVHDAIKDSIDRLRHW